MIEFLSLSTVRVTWLMYFREKNCYSYVRQVNPMVAKFYKKINFMEKSYETIALGTRMAAI